MPLNFYLHTRVNKSGEHPILLSLQVRGTRVLTSLGVSVDPSFWNESGSVKPRYVNSRSMTSKLINIKLNKVKIFLEEYELNQRVQPTKEELQEKVKEALAFSDDVDSDDLTFDENKTMIEYLKEFVEEQSVSNQWTHSTVKTWTNFRNHLVRFNPDPKFSDFNENGVNRYIYFLRKHEQLQEKTVMKQFTQLKWYLNWAIRKGYCREDYITKYVPKFKVLAKPVIFLTKDELTKLYNFRIPANGTVVHLTDKNGVEYDKTVEDAGALSKTRDLFCFCAFTSLRYSDMAKLKRTDVKDDYIYVTTQKTDDRLPINLNSFAKKILDKYRDQDFPKGLALPVISNQKMNDYIKDLCELCGFNDPITEVFYRAGARVEETYPKWALVGTHAARRTFICFALSQGIPPQVVMKWTGHSNYEAMKPYIDIASDTKVKAMDLFEQGMKMNL